MKPTAKIRLAMLVLLFVMMIINFDTLWLCLFCITCVDFVDSLDEGY